METTTPRYPVGIQTFANIREGNYLYVDKTDMVYRMANGAKYQFLSRPRRFGKSLLVSTLRSYFEGRRDLFRGLAIDSLEKEWASYPVLHFDMSQAKHCDEKQLVRHINALLEEVEAEHSINNADKDINDRLRLLIKHAYAKERREVVVLIDEYDAPLLDVVHEEQNLPRLRQVMRNFYSPLKACDPYLRFVFLTGITKFSQLSIFSELNNIENISMDEQYATLCGISKDELTGPLRPSVEALAARLHVDYSEACQRLREMYDGYHFTWPSKDIYNPYSLLMAMHKGRIDSYWFGSGTPTHLIEMLRKFGVAPSEIGGADASIEEFDAPSESLPTILPLLYQSGYLTIKGYDPIAQAYRLDIPNKEVRNGLMKSLVPDYVTANARSVSSTLFKFSHLLHNNDMDGLLRQLQAFLLTVPYCDNANSEGHYQQLLYVVLSLLGQYADVEVHTATGRVDMVLRTASALYIFELKLAKSAAEAPRLAAEAMAQIDAKNYPARFAGRRLPIVKVAAVFDLASRSLADGWLIRPA